MCKFKLPICIFLTFIISIFSFMPCFAEESTYVWSNNSTPVSSDSSSNNSLELESESAILIEQSSRANFI